jgi:hypothetical protein
LNNWTHSSFMASMSAFRAGCPGVLEQMPDLVDGVWPLA